MLSKVLPVAALAGAAMAACPLSVEITGSTDHTLNVAVTNNGAEAVTVFKGNTVLSEHNTMDILVADEDGNDLPFEGLFVNYKRTDMAPSMFQTIQAGETVSATVNTAKTYNLEGVAKAKAQAIQGFHYVTGSTAPKTIAETEFCENVTSDPVDFTVDQTTAAISLVTRDLKVEKSNSRIKGRSVSYSGCTSAQQSALVTSVSDAVSMSSAAKTAAGQSADYYTTWFKSTSVLTKVQTIYQDVVGIQTTSPTISCKDTYGDCADGSALLYTIPSAKVIVPCPSNGFWGFDELSPDCTDFDYDRAGSILHEATHLYGTDDYAYGPTAAKKLSAAQAAANADTYEMYAGSVRLGGCSG
ncbi:hypothetical protein PFICI_09960 [Pestalotiopsis fici W106-1]|uniref:deuterolysin n=1 Tax=Pestalotiopsis fici (strain W106-1 / CGMCC3.15140) TaxID=1229662 RepID=W3WVJ8_PESFW|nr:uncharacterized protein PFICI_09960 [Pestalotiopsis fici W106-1]ETS77898.1 hypothetical protein PFICI_09960 [Pestalotiopsis fici W106-1]